MANENPNLYSLRGVQGLDPQALRVMQDLTDRINYLTTELSRVREMTLSASPGVDAAAKEAPVEGIIPLSSPITSGQIRVSRDGVIQSYVTPAIPSSFQYLLLTDQINRTQVGAAETEIVRVSVPAKTLKKVGDFLEYVGEFDLQSVGVTKTIRYKFNGSDINLNPWNNTLASTQIVEVGRIYRTGPTSIRSYIACSLPFAGQTAPFTQFGDVSGLPNMDSNMLPFTVTLQGTNTNDITQRACHMFAVVQNP